MKFNLKKITGKLCLYRMKIQSYKQMQDTWSHIKEDLKRIEMRQVVT